MERSCPLSVAALRLLEKVEQPETTLATSAMAAQATRGRRITRTTLLFRYRGDQFAKEPDEEGRRFDTALDRNDELFEVFLDDGVPAQPAQPQLFAGLQRQRAQPRLIRADCDVVQADAVALGAELTDRQQRLGFSRQGPVARLPFFADVFDVALVLDRGQASVRLQ